MADTHCEVEFDSDDAEPVQFYDDRVITKSRKAHTCTECGGPIALGESYLRKSYRFEGEFCIDRVCDGCREVAGEFQHRFVGGMLWESFWNEWDEGANLQSCLNRLTTVRAKSTMQAQWLKWEAKRAEQRRAYQERRRQRDADKGS